MDRHTLALLACVAGGPACSSPPERPEPPRLVLLYATCSVNKAYLQPYDDRVDFTPNLSEFARGAAVLTNHQTESGLSGTAFASIFAGVQADRHGVFKHPRRLDEDLHLIFEAFTAAGFESYYWSDHEMAGPHYNYHQGVPEANVLRRALQAGDPRFQDLLTRLEGDRKHRALVVTAFSVTHGPYAIDALNDFCRRHPAERGGISVREMKRWHQTYVANYIELQTRFEQTILRLGLTEPEVARMAGILELTYRSRVELLDSMFGDVLSEIERHGLTGEALVVFTADHGETLFEENRPFKWGHAPDLMPEVINVPLILRGPGVVARRVNAVTRSMDLFPSLAGLAEVEIPRGSGVQGVDLSRALRGRTEFPELIADSHGTLRQWSFFSPDLIENIWASRKVGDVFYRWRQDRSAWRFEVFDVSGSTTLMDDLFDPADPHHRTMAEELWSYRSLLVQEYLERNPAEAMSREEELRSLEDHERQALQSLGYIH